MNGQFNRFIIGSFFAGLSLGIGIFSSIFLHRHHLSSEMKKIEQKKCSNISSESKEISVEKQKMTLQETNVDPSRSGTVQVVVQRCNSGEILIDNNNHWIPVKNALIFMISFGKGSSVDQIPEIAKQLVNIPLMSLTNWGSTPPKSVIDFVRDGNQIDILIIPQASLTSKIKRKSIQYHDQIDKNTGKILYDMFIHCVENAVIETILQNGHKQKQDKINVSVDPKQLFMVGQYKGKFSEFDDNGFPLKDIEGNPISKSQKKKLQNIYESHCIRYKKITIESEQSTEPVVSIGQTSMNEKEVNIQENKNVHNLPFRVVAGTFGNRQGFKMEAEIGPFTHSFTF